MIMIPTLPAVKMATTEVPQDGLARGTLRGARGGISHLYSITS